MLPHAQAQAYVCLRPAVGLGMGGETGERRRGREREREREGGREGGDGWAGERAREGGTSEERWREGRRVSEEARAERMEVRRGEVRRGEGVKEGVNVDRTRANLFCFQPGVAAQGVQ